ncbi:SDR family oxidoreductase [Streptomyces sp. NPDC058545]|uniref:SDR family oxidoreductase n=1 Tax=Streptomyces sp. NPDC058545 TaxID=3346544 RepID=UPI0036512DB8
MPTRQRASRRSWTSGRRCSPGGDGTTGRPGGVPRITARRPGPVHIPLNERDAEGDAAAQAALAAKVPLGRRGRPAAHAVLPLLAAASSCTTGSVVHVDGGCTAQ